MNRCTWTHDPDLNMWDTECGKSWTVLEGTLSENGMTFCPFCGKQIGEVPTARFTEGGGDV